MRPTIYGAFATSFFALAVYLLAFDFGLPGFNRYVLFSVSAIMALIMVWATLFAMRDDNTPEEKRRDPNPSIGRYVKILFASYGVAVGSTILIIVIGLFIFDFERVDQYLFPNVGLVLLGVTLLSVPVVSRYLR